MPSRLTRTQGAILAIGVTACAATDVWAGMTVAAAVPARLSDMVGAVAFLAFQVTPFAALAAAGRRISSPGALIAAVAFAAFMADAQVEVTDSTSSTAVILLFVAPLMLLFAVPVLVAMADGIRLLVLWRAGVAIRRPTRWHVTVGIAAAVLGSMLMMIGGAVAGLALGVAIWANDAAHAADAE